MYQQNPDQGAVNAGLNTIHNVFNTPGVLPRAAPSSPAVTDKFVFTKQLSPGGTATLGLTGSARRTCRGRGSSRATEVEAGFDHRRRLARLQARRR